MSKTVIETANLTTLAAKCFNCPDKMMTFAEISGILSKNSAYYITEDDVKAYRIVFLDGKCTLPAPLIDQEVVQIPKTLDDMFDYALIDTHALRVGAAKEAAKVYADTRKAKENKESISALKLMNAIADSIDVKLKALSPASDPASTVLGMDEFKKFKNILWKIDQKYPEFCLLVKYEEEMRKSELIEAEFTEV